MLANTIELENSKIFQFTEKLSPRGILTAYNNFIFLKIDDHYIHQLFPFLQDDKIKKPDYFGENKGGAHITVIYSEENRKIAPTDLGQTHHFSVKKFAKIKIHQKLYYALLVESPSLVAFRKKYNLPELLSFKGFEIGFHITIGVSYL